MSRISEEKKNRLKEEVMRIIFEQYPRMWWTYEIGDELIRDDEFMLKLLQDLLKSGLVVVNNESKGNKIKRKWGLNKGLYRKFKDLYW
jgi:hypothetical protein